MVSEVTLSVLLVPVSEDTSRSMVGADPVTVSVTTIVAVEALDTFPAVSAWVTVAVQVPSVKLLVVMYQFNPAVVVYVYTLVVDPLPTDKNTK